MDPDDIFEGDPCEQCEVTTFVQIDGIPVCTNGHGQGTQVAGHDDDNYLLGQRVRKKKVEKQREKVSKIYRGPKGYALFLKAYQFILWKQSHALIHKKGLSPELWTIVRSLWSLRLSQLVHRLELEKTGETRASPAASENVGEDPVDGDPKVSRRGRDATETPKLVETITLCYMGLLLLRLPVSLGEIYTWIKKEDVPFIRAIRAVPQEMRNHLPAEYHKSLDTITMIRPEDLHTTASNLALMYGQTFGLTLPPINHDILLYKHIHQLAVPLDVYIATQSLATITRAKFRYPTSLSARRKQGISFPELQLMAHVIVAVKLIYPLDGPKYHPRSSYEPAAQRIDWDSWEQRWRKSKAHPKGSKLSRGSHVDVQDADVFKMSEEEMNSYMDWYQETWVREPRQEDDEKVSKEILDMFPLVTLDPTSKRHEPDHERSLQEATAPKARETTSSMHFQPPIPEPDEQQSSPPSSPIQRPGSAYIKYKSEPSLRATARIFHEAAAEVACTSVRNLLLAVLQVESRVEKWRTARRRAEATGEKIDVDAELGESSEASEDESENGARTVVDGGMEGEDDSHGDGDGDGDMDII